MEVQVFGTYFFKNHSNMDLGNFDTKVEVPDGLKEHEVLSYLCQKEEGGFINPLHRILAKEDKQFMGTCKIKLASFVHKKVADQDAVDSDDFDSVDVVSGKMVLSDEFGDLAEEVEPVKKKIGRPKKDV